MYPASKYHNVHIECARSAIFLRIHGTLDDSAFHDVFGSALNAVRLQPDVLIVVDVSRADEVTAAGAALLYELADWARRIGRTVEVIHADGCCVDFESSNGRA